MQITLNATNEELKDFSKFIKCKLSVGDMYQNDTKLNAIFESVAVQIEQYLEEKNADSIIRKAA